MIDILLNTDKNYVTPCKVVIESIVRNTKESIQFHVIGEEFNSKHNIIFYDEPDLSILKNTVCNSYITTAACYRLFAPFISNLKDKVIYIDCDTIVLGDVKELWDIDVRYIKGVLDPMYKTQMKKNNTIYPYINSGVLLMNLNNLRKLDYLNMIRETQNGKYNLSLLDQDIINIAFNNYIELLPYEWNVYSEIFNEVNIDMYKAREIPKIIHWCGGRKPWNTKNLWMSYYWDKYKNLVDTSENK